MANGTPPLLDRVRRPEYTGPNRCVPCTIVNVAIAIVLSVLAGALFAPAGAALFVGSALAIYFRGYLIPGTPTLTKRYLPASIRERFDDHETDEEWATLQKVERHREQAVDPKTFLDEAGVVEYRSEGDDRLTDGFRGVYEEQLDRHRDEVRESATLAALFDADAEAVAFEDREYPAIRIGGRIRKWPSEAALLADVAIDAALTEWTDRWAGVPVEQRGTIRKGLRALVGSCPACGGALTTSHETVESCCGVHQVIAVECGDCGDRLRELDPDNADAKLTR